MKRVLLFCLIAIGMIAVSCEKKESDVNSPSRIATITVSAQSVVILNDTKVSSDNSGNFTWDEGDKIGVWTGSKLTEFTITPSSAGSSTATFTGELTGSEAITDESYAVYPYGYVTVNGTTATLNVESSFWARNAPAKLVPMYAKAGTALTTGFEFNMLSAAAKFTIKNIPDEIIAIYLEAQWPADPRTLWCKNGSTADLSLAEPAFSGTGDEGYALAVPNTADAHKSFEFYVPIMPGTYSDELRFKVKMFKDTGAAEVGEYTKTGKLDSKSTTYSRNQLLILPTLSYPKTVTSGISATIQNDLKWNMGATLGLYNGSSFNVLTLDAASVDKFEGTFSGSVPGTLGYAVTPATGATLSGSNFSYAFDRNNYPIYPVTYGNASETESFQMKHLSALLKITLKNVPVSATHMYFESWGGPSLMMSGALTADLTSPSPSYGDGIDWAFAAIPSHESTIESLTIYVPIKTGVFESKLNWCVCYTSNNAFGYELSQKARYYDVTPKSPDSISVGDVFDLGETTLTMN